MAAPTRIQRRLAWPDTDASGVWHHSTIWRWAEEAEAELQRSLGILEHFRHAPRRHVEADFLRPLRFDDLVDIELVVTAMGRTSVTYAVTVHQGDVVVARATMTAVHVADGAAAPWPAWAAAMRPDPGTTSTPPPCSCVR